MLVKGYARAIRRDVQQMMGALSSPIRREILWLVRDRELASGEIAAAFEVTAPTISQHLAVLREAGLVTVRIDGSFRRYRADPGGLDAVRLDVLGPGTRWTVADDLPETELANVQRNLAVTVETTVDVDVATAYRAFVDPVVYGRWLGTAVSLEAGRFATTLEWGTTIRGVYEVAVAPTLLALRWDFEDGAIPIPGSELVTYLRFFTAGPGARVVVHQLAADPAQAEFLEVAWSMVLGRLRCGVRAAVEADRPATKRQPRRKRSDPGPR